MSALQTSAPAHAKPPWLVIEPVAGWSALSVREAWRFRDLLFTLAARDIKLRYKQTALGVAWVVLQPLLAAAIFTFVFQKVARFESPGGVPYFLLALAGMVAWGLFSQTLTRSANSMVGNAHLVSKVYFPRAILPVSTAVSAGLDFLVGLAVLSVLVAWYWHGPGLAVLLAPLCVLILVLLALGLGLCATSLAVRFRDVQHAMPFFTQILLYASPVAYPVDQVPVEYRSVYYLNPLAAVLEGFRAATIGVGQVHPGWLAYSAGIAVAMVLIGAFAFERMERDVADVI